MPKTRSVKRAKVKYLPYASGFIPPSKEEQVKAIGCRSFVAPEYSLLSDDKGYEFFKQIPQPTSIDDWLAQYVDNGQTFQQYVSRCPWLFSQKLDGIEQTFIHTGGNLCEKYPDGKIYLLPIGHFHRKYFIDFDELVKFANIYLGIPVCTLPGVDLKINIKEKKANWINKQSNSPLKDDSGSFQFHHELEGRFYSKHNRYQLSISNLLSILQLNIPNDALCVIGLTMSDLYRAEADLFVAGWAAGRSRVAVFSFFRYDPSLTFSPADWFIQRRNQRMKPQQIQKSIFQRSCKLLVHEIGHLLGIGHCIFFECCMNGSGHLSEDFRQPMHLCPVDLHKLQTLVGFNVLKRYSNLLDFYTKHGMKDEVEWISRRIDFINNSPVEII
jgi:archaemetzincin